MTSIKIGPTGATVQGSVLDCNKQSLERAVKFYDPLLYIKWNPNKLNKTGVWELRRRPEKKTVKETIEYHGTKYHNLDYVELDIVNHIFDLHTLNYQVIEKLKKTDTWLRAGFDGHNTKKITRLLDEVEGNRIRLQEQGQKKLDDTMAYELKQDKAVFDRFREDIASGLNPAEIAKHWNK